MPGSRRSRWDGNEVGQTGHQRGLGNMSSTEARGEAGARRGMGTSMAGGCGVVLIDGITGYQMGGAVWQ